MNQTGRAHGTSSGRCEWVERLASAGPVGFLTVVRLVRGSAEKSIEEIVAAHLEVCCYVIKDGGEQTDAERIMRGNGNVMFTFSCVVIRMWLPFCRVIT